MKKCFLFLKILILLMFSSCDRELDLGNDFDYNFEVSLVNPYNYASVYNDIPIRLNINNLGLSSNEFQISYVSSNSGSLSFQSSGILIPNNLYTDVLEGEILLNYNSSLLGEQTLTFNCIDSSGLVKTISIDVEFLEPSFDFTQLVSYSTTSSNNALHEVFIENESYSSDTYQMKYEIINMNWVQEPGTTDIEPTVVVGDAVASSLVNLPTDQSYSNITNTLITLTDKKKINIKVSKGGFSQFQMKLTIKSSYGIEKTLIFDHNGVLPFYNFVDFIVKYKRQSWVPLGGSNLTHIYFSICINPPSVSGAALTSVKILTRANTETNYIVRYVGGLPAGNSYSYSLPFVHPNTGSDCFQVIRTILTYSNGTIYWVDKGTNYSSISPPFYGPGFNVNSCL